MIELVVIIVIIGALAAVAGPRFVGTGGFESRGFYDKSAAVIRAAQKTAVEWRGKVFVCVTATQVTVATDAACASPIANSLTGGVMRETAPSGVTLSAASFGFDALGQPVNGAGTPLTAATTITLSSTIAGDIARTIVVQPQTGYVAAN